eukprot:TRINITY_DN521_c0_g1_i3.p1 TRINITY_DN521_c0_g1~~TRINITY_DN521_c0_g1_i3.p1  ORF type:complete len:1069 (+),score=247.57 TRINITY_DN521_c0_g1_i3:274-3480(+)
MSLLSGLFGGDKESPRGSPAGAAPESPEAFMLPAGFLEAQAIRNRRGSIGSEAGDQCAVLTVADTNDLIVEIQRLHSDQRLIQAARVLHKLRSGLDRATTEHPDNEDMQAVREYVQSASWAKVVESDMLELSKYVDVFDEDEGWELAQDDDGIKTMYRQEEGMPTLSVRVEGVVEASALQCLHVFDDVENYTHWYPEVTESRRLLQISEFRSINYMKFGLPMPFSNRDLVMYAFGADSLEEDGAIYAAVRSCQTKDVADHHVVLPPVSGSDVRSQTKLSAHQFVPLTPNRTLVRFVSNVDLALGGVPTWLLNYISKQVSAKLLENLRTRVVNAGVGRFGVFERRLHTYFAQLEKPNAQSWGPPLEQQEAEAQPVVLIVDPSAPEGPCVYKTIQQAVDQACPMDTIKVCSGQYSEGGQLVVTKSLFILKDPECEEVALSCSIVFYGDKGKLEGLTVAPQKQQGEPGLGKGVSTNLMLELRGNSEAVVEHCKISGGILAADRSSPTVRNNRVRSSCRHGILIEGRARGLFEHNTVSQSARAGIAIRGEACPTLHNNTIAANRREGIQCKGGSVVSIKGNTIRGNLVGVSTKQHARCTITANKINDNVRAAIVSTGCNEPIVCASTNDLARNGEGAITPRGSDSDSDDDKYISSSDEQEEMPAEQSHESPLRPIHSSEMFRASEETSSSELEPESISKEFPMSGKAAHRSFSDCLTGLEAQEIGSFPDVYFVGERSHKPGASADSHNNHGLDDENGNYKLFPNDQIAFRYQVLKMLGSGSFGQVVECLDHKTKENVALKVITNEDRRHAQAVLEVQTLQYLQDGEPDLAQHNVVSFHGHFYFRNHLVISFPLLGRTLYEACSTSMPTKTIAAVGKQLAVALQFLRTRRIIHCDLKPDNVLFVSMSEDPADVRVQLIDFGTSCLEGGELYMYIQTRYYRAPSVILGITYDCEVDIWSLGCLLAELHMSRPLFPGDNEVDQLLRIMEVLGQPPMELVNQSSKRNIFFEGLSNRPRIVPNLHGKRRRPGTRSLSALMQTSDPDFLSFVSACVVWRPEDRLTPDTAFQHPFSQAV